VRCAFLTLEDAAGYVIDDDLAHAPLRELGWQVDTVPWRRRVSWQAYDAIVIRSTWDYLHDPDGFLSVLAGIEQAGVPLYNGLELVRWNLRKTYLRDLAERGVATVPTVFRDRLETDELPALHDALGADLVLKPQVGANAEGARRLSASATREEAEAAHAGYRDRPLLVQPFVPSIATEGEYSLVYFDGALSHAVLKTPRAADFRVQEEHGGVVRAVRPDELLREAGESALRALGAAPLYARVDLVRAPGGAHAWLMELELVEPSLYLRMERGAPARLARALHERVRARQLPARRV
jgi:glutathione synthase/RimK-type ligase-like ATP-grasp enzyme